MKLIDLESLGVGMANPAAFENRAHADGWNSLFSILQQAPVVDAEPVVRCRECKYYQDGICEQISYIMDGYYHGTFEIKKPDDFCSNGAKMYGGAK